MGIVAYVYVSDSSSVIFNGHRPLRRKKLFISFYFDWYPFS